MPLLSENFSGSPFRFSGHAETILPAILRKVSINWTRERLETPDGDFIDLDRISNGSKKLLVLLHGLEGSSNSTYIKGFARYFHARGFDICAVNFRSCSGELNLKPYSYHSGKTDDVHFILKHLLTSKQYHQIALTGFSLGGNVTLRYLAEFNHQLPDELLAAAAVSVPVDLEDSAKTMANFNNSLYMMRFLKSLNHKMKSKAIQFPNSIDLEGIDKIKTFHAFDDRFTAPLHGFNGALDYYHRCSALYVLDQIQTPVFLLNALNDPFLGEKCYPYKSVTESSKIFGSFTKHGGHVGFAEQFPNGNYYTEKRIFEFIIKQFLK